ncbi:MAG: hypothetical protein R6W68_13010 [Ignavibacteriaceae bacterium]
MKTTCFVLIIYIILFSTITFSQSDYEIVQDFKLKASQLEQRIKDASSMDEINTIAGDIELLNSQYDEHKELLDKSLYPYDFDKTLAKLKSELDIRITDFTQIEVLQTEVTVLRDEVDRLNTRNTELISQIAVLESSKKKDSETINRLNNLIADLKTSLLKRDNLVLSVVDSLLPQLNTDVSALTSDDKDKIASGLENNFVLTNVKRSLRDHVRFLDVTTLNPGDIKEIKKQQDEFVATWQKIGTHLIEVYADSKEKSNELKEIDLLFSNWQSAIRNEAWNSIKEEFAMNNIILQDFNSGQEFLVEATRFIDEEFKNYGIKSKEESEQVYALFVDSTWNKSVQPDWMPYLLDNNMITAQQKNLIESKVSEWKNIIYPRDITFVYYIIGAVLLVAVLFFLIRGKRKPNPVEESS